MKYRGVAYYPEYWPEERWDEDIRLMREAHINMVRVGEFAWVAMEPAEGEFTLDWLHRLVQKMGGAGINVILCTPTATPPAWMTHQYPEVLVVREAGDHLHHGIRRHHCPTSPTYRRHSRRITEKLVSEFAKYSNVLAWQLDNELGPERGWCHCENCQAEYRNWLRQRYGSIEELNSKWGTRFWSMDYSQWEQVRMARKDMSPAALLDTRRFRSQAYVDFAEEQVGIIRTNHPKAIITTNCMGPIFEPINYYKLYKNLDYSSADIYFDMGNMASNALCADNFRCYKEDTQWWMLETGVNAVPNCKAPVAGQLRAWAFSGLARGCEAWSFFRWRTCLSGQEQELQGAIGYSGKPGKAYQAMKELFGELEGLRPVFDNLPMPRAEVAIVHDYDVNWGYRASVANDRVQFKKLVQEVHRAFYDRNILTDVIPSGRDLSRYKLLVLPSLTMVDGEIANRLRQFVEAGGTVVAFPQLSCRDRNNSYLPECAPVGLHDLFGLQVEGGMYLRSFSDPDESIWFPEEKFTDETPVVRIEINGQEITGNVRSWMEDIELQGGAAIGKFADNDYAGGPFLIEKMTGNGRTFYLAAYPQPDLLAAITKELIAVTGCALHPETPQWVEIVKRGDYTFITNHRDENVSVQIQGSYAIVGDYADGTAKLGPYGVCMLQG